MSEFAKTIAVALLIVAMIAFAFGGADLIQSSGASGGTGFRFVPAGTEIGRVTTEEGFFVGVLEVEDFRRVRFSNFIVSYLKDKTTVADFRALDVRKGLMRNVDKRVTFEVANTAEIVGGSLEGEVANTNRYGAFVVKLNGDRVFAKTMKVGEEFSADVPKEQFVNGTNELVFSATSSGWRVWAPAVYITDVKFASAKQGELAKTLTFSIPEDRYPINQGRMIFRATGEGSGELTITVNGERVYNDVPESGLTIVDFRGDLVEQNDNIVAFRADGNAEYDVRDPELIYFYNAGPDTNATQTFTLKKADVDSLPGTLSFRIDRVFGKPEGLIIDLKRPDRTVTRIVPQGVLEADSVISITLTASNVDKGENSATFLVKGDGGYRITEFEVRP